MQLIELTQGSPEWQAHRARKPVEKHGYVGTKEYNSYNAMKDRCYNPNNKRFDRYGGRGIGVCEKWKNSFSAFIADMGNMPGEGYTIERLNIDKDYSPENCIWAIAAEQAKNRSNNNRITIDGKTMIMSEWSKSAGINRTVLLRRLKRGLTGKKLIEPHCVKKINAFGITDTIAGWSRRTGIKASTISARIRYYGWDCEKAVTEGVK